MARIAGVNIPTAKRVPIALQYITGIGAHVAEQISSALNIDLGTGAQQQFGLACRSFGTPDEEATAVTDI